MPKPNIVILILDSARSDWLPESPAGVRTSELGSIENSGQWFSSAHAHSITSASSMGSLATGLHPFKHGLVPATGALSKDITTIAERMGEAGYQTIAVSANTHFSSHTNLNRGFDDFRFISSNPKRLLDELRFTELLRYITQIRSESAGFDLKPERHTVTPLLNSLIRSSIDSANTDNRPIYLLAHYIEPHSPYYPPRKLLNSREDRHKASLACNVHDEMYERMARECQVSQQEYNALKEMYSVEISYTVRRAREAIEYIDSHTSRNTIVVLTADHGDLFGEQNLLFHGHSLHDKLTNVPLFIRGLSVADTEAPTMHIDVIRTLLEIAEADTTGLDGIDLRSETRDRFVTQRPYKHNHDLIRKHDGTYSNEYTHQKPVTAFHINGYKMSVSEDQVMFFEPKSDIREERILKTEAVPVRGELESWSENWFSTHGRSVEEGEKAQIDGTTRKHLEDMGYL